MRGKKRSRNLVGATLLGLLVAAGIGRALLERAATAQGKVLKFTQDGRFLKQFGFEYPGGGSNDSFAFGQVAKIFVDKGANEAYISDGYRNKRVAVIES